MPVQPHLHGGLGGGASVRGGGAGDGRSPSLACWPAGGFRLHAGAGHGGTGPALRSPAGVLPLVVGWCVAFSVSLSCDGRTALCKFKILTAKRIHLIYCKVLAPLLGQHPPLPRP